jgi:hypothetical protein
LSFQANVWNDGWSVNDVFFVSLVSPPVVAGANVPGMIVARAQAGSGGSQDRVGIFFTAVSDISAGSRPVVWLTRYPGIST